MEVKVKKLNSAAVLPRRGSAQAAGYDLFACLPEGEVVLQPGETRRIPLGLAMALPEGYEAHVVPRSSTYINYHVIQSNHMGVIDNSYRGDNDQWMFPAIALTDTYIPKGTRICQFRVVEKQPPITFETVEHLAGSDRGGFGSTGER